MRTMGDRDAHKDGARRVASYTLLARCRGRGTICMHTAKTAHETLESLWNNYLVLCEKVDLDSMPPEALDICIENKSPQRPFRIAAWLARQGDFISAWSLWEYYSRSLCQFLSHKEKKLDNESTVEWVARSLAANSKAFTEESWFASANCVRNLIAHSGGRVDGPKGQTLLERSQTAFPKIAAWQDGYLALEHEHVADLHTKIEDYIRQTA